MASLGIHSLVALRGKRKIDHQDRILLDDADQQDDADERNHIQVRMKQHQRQDRAHAGGRQSRQNRDGMNVAFVQNAEHDVDGHESRDNQKGFGRERGLKGLQAFLKTFRGSWPACPFSVPSH